jgi:hypothetical protein
MQNRLALMMPPKLSSSICRHTAAKIWCFKEIMDFTWNYYAEVDEEGTGVCALELLIDR